MNKYFKKESCNEAHLPLLDVAEHHQASRSSHYYYSIPKSCFIPKMRPLKSAHTLDTVSVTAIFLHFTMGHCNPSTVCIDLLDPRASTSQCVNDLDPTYCNAKHVWVPIYITPA